MSFATFVVLITTFNAPANSIQKYAPAQKCNFSPSWTVVDKPLLSLGLLLFMKQIPLTQGKFALVDDEDYEYLMQWKWHAVKYRNTFYAKTNLSRKVVMGMSPIRMHRIILGLTDPSIKCDHKNGNGLDNQRTNLRACSNAENCRNSRLPKNNTSGYKGLIWHNKTQSWNARICVNRRKISLGYHKTKEEAAAAYAEAAKKHHGEYANLGY